MSAERQATTMPRRDVLKASGYLLPFAVGTRVLTLSPAEAHARKLPFTTLSAQQAAEVEVLAEGITPGAMAAGISYYLDHHLGVADAECLLMIRYLGVAPPYLPFYAAALHSTAARCRQRFKRPLAELDAAQLERLIGDLAQGNVEPWSGPPAALFYFVLRADATDVVYGTQAGFERLGVPYMAHIEPPTAW
jgi:hypothetical protein